MIMGVPYDAEVEYLESTGTQWIDTGYKPNGTSTVQIEVLFQYTYSNVGLVYIIGSNNPWAFAAVYGDADTAHVFYVAASFSYEQNGILLPNNNYSGNKYDKTIARYTSVAGASSYPFPLFARINGNTGVVDASGNKRIFSSKITNGGVLFQDLIPVRIGTVGYMYDRVSKKLFGNQGAGSFILGPDVAKPVMGIWRYRDNYSASDYIRDGLVAMWDGIENAGWRTHDPNATVWKDLVGATDLTPNRTPVWRDSEVFINDWNTYFSATVPTVVLDSFNNHSVSLEILYGSVDSVANNTGPFGIGDANFEQAWPFYIQQNRLANTACNLYVLTSSAWQPSPSLLGDSPGANSSMAFTMSGKSLNVYSFYSGEKRIEASKTATYTETIPFGSIISIGRAYNQQTGGWAVRCVRLYSRALTADEIAYNYNIDKVRFNLP